MNGARKPPDAPSTWIGTSAPLLLERVQRGADPATGS